MEICCHGVGPAVSLDIHSGVRGRSLWHNLTGADPLRQQTAADASG